MPRVGFEPTISAGKQPQTYVLDRAATGTGKIGVITNNNYPRSTLWRRRKTETLIVYIQTPYMLRPTPGHYQGTQVRR